MSAFPPLATIERAQIDASAGHQRWTMMDMHMLIMLGGRERTEAEFQALFAVASFKWKRALLLPGATGFSLIEAIPA